MKWLAIKWTAIVALIAGSLYGGVMLLKDWRFDTDAPPAAFSPPADLAEAREQDVQHLGLFFDYERSWTPATKAAARAEYERLATAAAGMSDAQFELAVARLVALADNAHTKVREYSRTPRFSRLAVRGHWFADGYHVVRAFRGFEHLLGHRFVDVEGVPMDEVFRRLAPYIAGPVGTLKKYTPYLIESPELMHAAGITASPGQMEVTFENRLAEAPENMVKVLFQAPYPESSDQIARSHYLLTRQVYATSQPDWAVLSGASESTPAYLDFPAQQMQMRAMPDLDATYLQFWTNSNVGSTSIGAFCEQGLQRFLERPSRHLVVDQRFNGGGNFGLTQDCLQAFGQHLTDHGHLYIIVGGATFSAGMYSAAFLKDSARNRATLVGEAVGDRLQHWAEDNLLRLPNSEIEIKFSTGMHDLAQPCRDWRKCHWGALFVELDIDTLDPDIEAPLTFSDYINGVDPAMEAIRRDIHSRQ